MTISIIVPVYNREHTISTCIIGALRSLTFDFECIIVNDGSTDGTLSKCQEIAANDPRVRVFTQENRGVSAARNYGIKVAKGEFLLFLDSDDTLAPYALDNICKFLTPDTDMLMYGAKRCNLEEISNLPNGTVGESPKVLMGNKNVVKWIYSYYESHIGEYYFVWSKIFRASVIRKYGIVFREDISLGEDQVFVADYLRHVSKIIYTNNVYIYNINWSEKSRPFGLGSVLRTPENFLKNQIANYQSLISLYESTNQSCVREYAANYILDRLISRIIFRHVSLINKGRCNLTHLIQFIKREIKPLILKEEEYFYTLKSVRLEKVAKLIRDDKVMLAVAIAFCFVNLGIIKSYILNNVRRLCDK